MAELSEFYFEQDITESGGTSHPIILTMGMPAVSGSESSNYINRHILNVCTPNGQFLTMKVSPQIPLPGRHEVTDNDRAEIF